MVQSLASPVLSPRKMLEPPVAFFSNRDINLLSPHAAVGNLASALSYVFSAVFLIRAGLTPAQVFLAFAAILALRFLMRPTVLLIAPAIGLRRTLILGTT